IARDRQHFGQARRRRQDFLAPRVRRFPRQGTRQVGGGHKSGRRAGTVTPNPVDDRKVKTIGYCGGFFGLSSERAGGSGVGPPRWRASVSLPVSSQSPVAARRANVAQRAGPSPKP